MDHSTSQQWEQITKAHVDYQRSTPARMFALLELLDVVQNGFSITQKQHSLQTAALAQADGADEELVVASLFHDIGKVFSVPNHSAIAGELLRPYVRSDVCEAIAHHQDFQGRHYYAHIGKNPQQRDRYAQEPWFDLAERFADCWDQVAFDPSFDTPKATHFTNVVESVFSRPRYLS